jgi:small subunit ribosomal protein S20
MSCKKRMKQAAKQRMRNRAVQAGIRRSVKALRSSTSRAEADSKLKEVISIIDKASRKKVVHKNKAARDKSKLMSFVNGLSG